MGGGRVELIRTFMSTRCVYINAFLLNNPTKIKPKPGDVRAGAEHGGADRRRERQVAHRQRYVVVVVVLICMCLGICVHVYVYIYTFVCPCVYTSLPMTDTPPLPSRPPSPPPQNNNIQKHTGHCVMNPCTGNQDCHFHEISLNEEQSIGPTGACVRACFKRRYLLCMCGWLWLCAQCVRPSYIYRPPSLTPIFSHHHQPPPTTNETGQFKPSPHPMESYIKITATAPKADGSGAS